MRGPPRHRGRPTSAPRPFALSERLVLIGTLGLAIAGLALWTSGEVALLLAGAPPSAAPPSRFLSIAVGVLAHPRQPAMAWPVGLRHALPPPVVIYLGALACIAVPALGALRLWPGRGGPHGPGPAAWAGRSAARPLLVAGVAPRRLILGRMQRRLVATEAAHSVLVLGPSQSGKTSGLAIPALLEWQGPVIATSVKSDLVRDTAAWRAELGRVQLFDPTGVSGTPGASWSPLAAATSWPGARRVAAAFCSVARHGAAGEDGEFWYATAEKLLAPLLFAAAASGATMRDVVRWVDTLEVDEVLDALDSAAVPEATRAAEASFRRDARQLSSVYTTTEMVLAAFADPQVLAATERDEVRAGAFLDGGAHTVYLVAPSHEQQRLAPVFVALLRELLDAAFRARRDRRRASRDPTARRARRGGEHRSPRGSRLARVDRRFPRDPAGHGLPGPCATRGSLRPTRGDGAQQPPRQDPVPGNL